MGKGGEGEGEGKGKEKGRGNLLQGVRGIDAPANYVDKAYDEC